MLAGRRGNDRDRGREGPRAHSEANRGKVGPGAVANFAVELRVWVEKGAAALLAAAHPLATRHLAFARPAHVAHGAPNKLGLLGILGLLDIHQQRHHKVQTIFQKSVFFGVV